MTVLVWVLYGLAAWTVVATLVGLLFGPVLRRNTENYTLAEQGRTDLLDQLERWDSVPT